MLKKITGYMSAAIGSIGLIFFNQQEGYYTYPRLWYITGIATALADIYSISFSTWNKILKERKEREPDQY